MRELKFEEVAGAAPSAGLVLRIPEKTSQFRYLRVTHAFDAHMFGMWIGSAEQARVARKPFPMPWKLFNKLANTPGAAIGRVALPSEFTRPLTNDKLEELESIWQEIAPLIKAFDRERTLRGQFTALVRDRAQSIKRPFNYVWRLVLRYYYFGGRTEALQSLPRGPEPEENGYDKTKQPKRRGRKSVALEKAFGPNQFVLGEEDKDDMVRALRMALAKGPTTVLEAYEDYYLKALFRKRHPELYKQYLNQKIPPPVTERQYRRCTNQRMSEIDRTDLKNLKRARKSDTTYASVRASGPGAVYEIDATGLRVVLATEEERPVELGTPWMYLVIDRWARYVVAVYLTLLAPSLNEVKQVLLVMLTSRERFRMIKLDITDEEWPGGRAPALLCVDRGAEFLSEGFAQAVAKELRTPLDVLPPMTPNGKGPIERNIQTLKNRIARRLKTEGGYAERPTKRPQANRAYRSARKRAVRGLASVYRVVISEVLDYNRRPHRTLQSYPELAAHGVNPVPRDAFVWGLKHISGLDAGPIADDDFRSLLRHKDKATGIGKKILYNRKPYSAANAAAINMRWPDEGTRLTVEVDELGREVRVWKKGAWGVFRLDKADAERLGDRTLQEERVLTPIARQRAVVTEQHARTQRLNRCESEERARRRRDSPRVPGRAEKLELREGESRRLKTRLAGAEETLPRTGVPHSSNALEARDEDRLSRQMEIIRKQAGLT